MYDSTSCAQFTSHNIKSKNEDIKSHIQDYPNDIKLNHTHVFKNGSIIA